MKKTIFSVVLVGMISLVGCANSQDTKTAMQKQYRTKEDCRREFPKEGDCREVRTGSGGMIFMSPYFYPWGAIMHGNGSVSYNQKVPSSGYVPAPASVQKGLASSGKVNFSRVPSSYGTVRGGFGTTGRVSASS